MKPQIQKEGEFIGDIWFPVLRERFSKIPLWPIFMKGYGGCVLFVLAIRCLFFIGADFAPGKVVHHDTYGAGRQLKIIPMVEFKTKEGKEMFVTLNRELYLKVGDEVEVIYKAKNPQRALVYSYAGFWANSAILCLVLLMFWIGLPLAIWGFNDGRR